MKQVRARILIEGRLQGRNFRYESQKQAQALNLVGFVRTLSDGRIEIEAQGEERHVEALLDWCQQEPYGSQIRSLFYRYDALVNNYINFIVR